MTTKNEKIREALADLAGRLDEMSGGEGDDAAVAYARSLAALPEDEPACDDLCSCESCRAFDARVAVSLAPAPSAPTTAPTPTT